MDYQRKRKIELLFLVAITIPLSLFVVKNINYEVPQNQNTAQVIEATLEVVSLQNFYFIKDLNQKPIVSAEAYLVGDLNTGEIILAKNQEGVFPIASISKLMTATISEEIQDPKGVIQMSKKALATSGENGNFHLGEKIPVNEILYPLLIESSNDAAVAIAEHSGLDIFINEMNQKAKNLGLGFTSFTDSSGLSKNNQSTTLDLFKLAKYTKDKHPELFKITLSKSYKDGRHIWFSNNQFLYKEGYLGGKSGYTDEAKQTVLSLFSLPLGNEGNRDVAIALLQSNDRAKDVESILKYLKKNIYYGTEIDAESSWVKEKEGVAEIKDPDFVTLAFAGDIMLDRGVKSSVSKNFNGDYSKLFEKLEILKTHDVVFANLEGTASDKGKDTHNLYSFRMDPSVIPALKGAGMDILSVANNHVGDWGILAYVDTLARLRENEILYTGGGFNDQEAGLPTIVEKYGIKIGYLGFSDKGPENMIAGKEAPGILSTSNPDFDQIIKNSSTLVDFLVVSFHFGEEYQAKHNKRQEELAHRAVDNGAKIVVGSHPHVIQDTEVYKNSYIAYSLGNFIFDQRFSVNVTQGLILGIKLNKDGSMSVTKNIVKSNRVFQPDTVIKGKEEKVKFQEVKTPTETTSQLP